MFDDEPIRANKGPLSAVETEDLTIMGVKELAERITRLKSEIERTETVLGSKQRAKDAASSLFKS